MIDYHPGKENVVADALSKKYLFALRTMSTRLTLSDDGSPNVNEFLLYVNGAVETTYTSTSGESINTGTTNDVRIGVSLMNSRWFDGRLDDVRIYNTDLSASQILELYNQGRR